MQGRNAIITFLSLSLARANRIRPPAISSGRGKAIHDGPIKAKASISGQGTAGETLMTAGRGKPWKHRRWAGSWNLGARPARRAETTAPSVLP